MGTFSPQSATLLLGLVMVGSRRVDAIGSGFETPQVHHNGELAELVRHRS
jgi:hypothetical protein